MKNKLWKLFALAVLMIVAAMLVCCEKEIEPEPEIKKIPVEERVEYTGYWLEKTEENKDRSSDSANVIIGEIYSNCFFVTQVVPLPYIYKINGTLSEEWCVGDKVYCTWENVYCDNETYRIEADLVSIEESDFELEEGVCYKPVIYLYPEKETEVNVSLELNGGLTCTYPAYNDGWTVTACPDGTLTDENGKIYNYLYWEGETYADYDFSKGFCVKGEDTAKFLETALTKLGLNRREANEFIVYWLPLMQENEYNIISFQSEAYTDAAKLSVEPAPDTLIRVFMTYKASDEFVEIEEQNLTCPERCGFTIVEWGGTEVKN